MTLIRADDLMTEKSRAQCHHKNQRYHFIITISGSDGETEEEIRIVERQNR
jgi:hypothetical protein